MKIVILNGSPNKQGTTKQLCDYLFKDQNEVITYYAYDNKVKACIGCNYCFNHKNKCIYDGKDDFKKVMADVIEADLLVLASPLHFSSFSGKLLSLISRLQVYFPLKYYYKEPLPFKDKKGLSIIVGGNDYPTMFDAIKPVDRIIYNHTNAKQVKRLLFKGSDQYSFEELITKNSEFINEIKLFIKKD
ncbi:MAG: flavodoxin family protein [Bacilli bacterium]|jgi:multimeric flavodoxin WrbA|nr:flavodoxin family protein [Bacilli bacterium]